MKYLFAVLFAFCCGCHLQIATALFNNLDQRFAWQLPIVTLIVSTVIAITWTIYLEYKIQKKTTKDTRPPLKERLRHTFQPVTYIPLITTGAALSGLAAQTVAIIGGASPLLRQYLGLATALGVILLFCLFIHSRSKQEPPT